MDNSVAFPEEKLKTVESIALIHTALNLLK